MSRALGDAAEAEAVEWLRREGFRIVDRNVSSRFGEIDIIAMRGDILHIIEVKSARTYEQAVGNVTTAKVQKILKTAHIYLKRHRLEIDYQLDAVIVTPEACRLLENITI